MDQNLDLTQLRKLAQSPAGQQLMKLLQQQGGKELQTAVQKASSGDLESARQALSAVLSSPEAKKLLKQLEETK